VAAASRRAAGSTGGGAGSKRARENAVAAACVVQLEHDSADGCVVGSFVLPSPAALAAARALSSGMAPPATAPAGSSGDGALRYDWTREYTVECKNASSVAEDTFVLFLPADADGPGGPGGGDAEVGYCALQPSLELRKAMLRTPLSDRSARARPADVLRRPLRRAEVEARLRSRAAIEEDWVSPPDDATLQAEVAAAAAAAAAASAAAATADGEDGVELEESKSSEAVQAAATPAQGQADAGSESSDDMGLF
jgi:hypothetical protein